MWRIVKYDWRDIEKGALEVSHETRLLRLWRRNLVRRDVSLFMGLLDENKFERKAPNEGPKLEQRNFLTGGSLHLGEK